MTNNNLASTPIAGLAAGFILVCGAAAHGQSPAGSPLDKKLDSPFASFRLGAALSPISTVDAGVDVTFPHLRIGTSWTSRLDVEFGARFNSPSFGSRRDAEVSISACQVYTPGGVNRGRYFLGAGLGPSFGPQSGLRGKIFAGLNFSPVVSIEAEAQFPPNSPVRAVFMLRLSAL
jgi:hypothetical protein